jgi:putative ABC transport system ATP-binding protein
MKSRHSILPFSKAPVPLSSDPQSQNVSISAHDVNMTFQMGSQSYQALDSIHLDVPAGSIQLLMGPSGSGKTTLLSILGGILRPTSGEVKLLGHDITRMSKSQLTRFRLKHVGFIFQGFNLFPALTAVENIEVALKLKGMRSRPARWEARLLLEQVGLAHKANAFPKDLSGGQKQRVAIARALAGNPKLILADEPTAALDSSSGHQIIELLRHLAKEKGCTVLMVTHDPRIIDVADQVAYLEDGQIQADRSELFEKSSTATFEATTDNRVHLAAS